MNSSSRVIVVGPADEQAAARAAYVARLTRLVRAGSYTPTVEGLVLAMTGRRLHAAPT